MHRKTKKNPSPTRYAKDEKAVQDVEKCGVQGEGRGEN